MTKEEFFQEIKNANDEKKAFMDKIKSHDLPIIVFGAGQYAEEVTNILNAYGVKISGYAVDGQYYKPNETYLGLPIYNFSELYLEPEKYVFIRGINKDSARKKTLIQNFKDIQTVLVTKAKNLTANYVWQNRDKFYETYTLLADDLSKETMISYLKAAVADNLDHIQDMVEPHHYEYFNDITRNVIDARGGGGYTSTVEHISEVR